MQAMGGGGSFTNRLVGVLRLSPATFEDVEHDQNATVQALIVVVLAALTTGIGAAGNNGNSGLIGGIVGAILGWIAFSVFAFAIGARFFATSATSVSIGQVLRTVGFAQAPKLLLIVGFVPIFGGIVALIAWIWFVAAAVVGLRQAFDFTTERAIGTAVGALIAQAIVAIIIGLIFGVGAAVFGAAL